MSHGTLHAGMSLQDIVNALARVNWGPLRGRAWAYRRMVLQTLALMMREQKADYSAELITSARQVADRTGCCEKTVRRCLHDMEDLGLVEWRRGGIWDGRPMPSVIKVIKARLVEWTLAWRPKFNAAQATLRAETLRRIGVLERARIRPRLRPEVHADFAGSLLSVQKRAPFERALASKTFIPARPAERLKEWREIRAKTAHLRKEAKKMRQAERNNVPVEYLPLVCEHALATSPSSCNTCRSKAMQDYQAHQRLEREEAARKRAEQRTREEVSEEAKGTAFAEYMKATYPSARRSEWSDLILIDEEAARLANA